MTRTARPVIGTVVAAVALIALIAACGSSATAAPGTVAPGTSTNPGSTAAADTNDPFGGLLGSLGLGSLGIGNLLHGAPDLEAVLPAQMCGAATIKLSFGGASFGAAAGQIPAFYTGLFGATGKTMADVSFATASSTGSGDCPDITAFKINGLDEATLTTLYTQLEVSDGATTSQVSLGGKNVLKSSDGKYAYVKGDTVFEIDTTSDDTAAAALQLLP